MPAVDDQLDEAGLDANLPAIDEVEAPLSNGEREELVYLRKLRTIHSKQIRAMGESNATLQLLSHKLEDKLDSAVARIGMLEAGGARADVSTRRSCASEVDVESGRPSEYERQCCVLSAEKVALADRLEQGHAEREALVAQVEALSEELAAARCRGGQSSVGMREEVAAYREHSAVLEQRVHEQELTIERLMSIQQQRATEAGHGAYMDKEVDRVRAADDRFSRLQDQLAEPPEEAWADDAEERHIPVPRRPRVKDSKASTGRSQRFQVDVPMRGGGGVVLHRAPTERTRGSQRRRKGISVFQGSARRRMV